MAAAHTSLLRRLTPKGLFWRSLLILLIPLVLLQGVVAYIFFERHWDTVSRRLALGLTGDIIYVMPPFVIDLDDLTHLTNAMVKVIGEWSTLQGVNVGP